MSGSTITEPTATEHAPGVALPSCVIVAEHASMQMGGEAAIPWHYFRVLRARGADVHLVVHERVRAELDGLVATGDEDRLHYVRDSTAHKVLHRIGERLPARLAYFSVGFVMRFLTQLDERRIARRLVAEHGLEVVHQPIPVSPREPSLMSGLGAPVVIGPMNGGMSYPPGFSASSATSSSGTSSSASSSMSAVRGGVEALGLLGARLLHRILPGKRRAAVLLVANDRTRAALQFRRAEAVELVENGVDLSVWRPSAVADAPRDATEFMFLGRLVGWKAVDIAIEALGNIADEVDVRLTVVGDGPERAALERAAAAARTPSGAPLGDRISFLGWQPQDRCAELLGRADVLVLPSLYECGGAVVLEAMAMGKPVIATDWGGPADYLDASCGVLVAPTSREGLVGGFADAMAALAASPERRRELGAGGRQRVDAEFDWEIKVDRIVEVYRSAIHIGADRADRSH